MMHGQKNIKLECIGFRRLRATYWLYW